MVDAHARGAAASLTLVATALHDAVAHDAVDGGVFGVELGAAEAFACIFKTGVGEAATFAEVDAALDCVVAAAVRGACEGAV